MLHRNMCCRSLNSSDLGVWNMSADPGLRGRAHSEAILFVFHPSFLPLPHTSPHNKNSYRPQNPPKILPLQHQNFHTLVPTSPHTADISIERSLPPQLFGAIFWRGLLDPLTPPPHGFPPPPPGCQRSWDSSPKSTILQPDGEKRSLSKPTPNDHKTGPYCNQNTT